MCSKMVVKQCSLEHELCYQLLPFGVVTTGIIHRHLTQPGTKYCFFSQRKILLLVPVECKRFKIAFPPSVIFRL